MTKSEVRRLAREISGTIEDKPSRSAAIAARVSALPEYRTAKSIFIFVSLPSEPDTSAMTADAFAQGKRVFVPRCRKNEPGIMDAVEIFPDTVLISGAYGIREPSPELPAADIDPDCMIIPCAAAGADMGRLGHGAGYYDRFLSGKTGVRIMLCFDALVFPTVPRDSFDIDPHIIITESRTITERM